MVSTINSARAAGLFPSTASLTLPDLRALAPSKRPNGLVLWEGFSPVDGAPLVAIATGLVRSSDNRKTGPMVQVWILRADVAPLDAINTGADQSQCGDCPLRPIKAKLGTGGGCYVQVGQAPASVWKAYRRGAYPRVTQPLIREAFDGRAVRLGAYGDPARVPSRILKAWISRARRWTGYTHQWRASFTDDIHRGILMASADSPPDRVEARALGWRYFGLAADPTSEPDAIECPADQGKVTCATCGLCNGDRSGAPVKSILIRPHGAASARATLVASR